MTKYIIFEEEIDEFSYLINLFLKISYNDDLIDYSNHMKFTAKEIYYKLAQLNE